MRIWSSCCLTYRFGELAFFVVAVVAFVPQASGSLPPSKEFVTPVCNQDHQVLIVVGETTRSDRVEQRFRLWSGFRNKLWRLLRWIWRSVCDNAPLKQAGSVPVPQFREQIAEVVTVVLLETYFFVCVSSENYHKRGYYFTWSRESHLLLPRQHACPEFIWFDISISQRWVALPTFWRNLGDEL